MNWLHCCWGVGATGASLIMTSVFNIGLSLRAGYAAIAAIQASFTTLFFLALKLWPANGQAHSQADKPARAKHDAQQKQGKPKNFLRNAVAGCVFYFLYTGVETSVGLWGASLLIDVMNVPIKTAGLTISLFWGSLTAGRLITGAFLHGFTDRAIIRGGLATAGLGISMLISAKSPSVATVAFALTGLGLAPLYPSMMHDTPRRVGGAFAENIIGLQVGAAFAGISMLPALIGYAAARLSLAVIAPVILCIVAAITIAHEISAQI